MNINYDEDIANMFSGGTSNANSAEKAGLLDKLSLTSMGVAGLAEMGSAFGKWSQTGTQAGGLRVQADLLELEAEQKGNMLREKLFGDISNSFAGYAARGVDIGSGSPISMTELTMKEGIGDIQQIKKNARMKVDSLRKQATILEKGSRFDLFGNFAMGIAKTSLGVGGLLGE